MKLKIKSQGEGNTTHITYREKEIKPITEMYLSFKANEPAILLLEILEPKYNWKDGKWTKTLYRKHYNLPIDNCKAEALIDQTTLKKLLRISEHWEDSTIPIRINNPNNPFPRSKPCPKKNPCPREKINVR